MKEEEKKDESKEFWVQVPLPYNDEDDLDEEGQRRFELVNRVVAAESFVKRQSMISRLCYQREVLEKKLANMEVQLTWKERELSKIHHRIISSMLQDGTISRSTSSKIVDAMIPAVAVKMGLDDELGALEREVEELRRDVERRRPMRDILTNRIQTVFKLADHTREYLQFEKLELRMNSNRP